MNKEELVEKILKEIDKQEENIKLYGLKPHTTSSYKFNGTSALKENNTNRYSSDSALHSAEKKLKKLLEALDTINEAHFAICKKCGKKILIKPQSKHSENIFCINCVS